jgi:hypothetical protein
VTTPRILPGGQPATGSACIRLWPIVLAALLPIACQPPPRFADVPLPQAAISNPAETANPDPHGEHPNSGLRSQDSVPSSPSESAVRKPQSLISNSSQPAALNSQLSTNQFTLPGTQPHERPTPFYDVERCVKCHAQTPNGLADPYISWHGGMMAQAARDPVFRAALAIANQDLKGSGEYCIRCHAPRAWLEGRSTAADGSLLKGDDLHGVSCDVCHHFVDPLSEEAKKFAKQTPPGYGNGMFVVDSEANRMRGPYADTRGSSMHQLLLSPYHATSELCGNCHNVSNPAFATNVLTQPPHAFGHIERTYSEWALSDFAKAESRQTCQSCHFPPVPGGGRAVNYATNRGELHRDYFVAHTGAGGSTWVQDAVALLWPGPDVDPTALSAGKDRARALLKTAAALGLDCTDGRARLTITNLTGHKLPTGYPEGRRMWVNVRFFGRGDKLIGELGRYGETKARLDAAEVSVPTLLDPEWTRVYECLPGISPAQAAKCGHPPGPSLHFVLNDVTAKDNRIPPRGFQQRAFAEHLAAPVMGPAEQPPGAPPFAPLTRGVVGASNYADGQYWDELHFDLPAGTERVEVRLMYQSVSWEYLKFLFEENKTDAWGERLYGAWDETGKCPPEEIAIITRKLPR